MSNTFNDIINHDCWRSYVAQYTQQIFNLWFTKECTRKGERGLPAILPPTNQNITLLKTRVQTGTILLDMDGTLGYSLIPQSQAEKAALEFVLEWWSQQCHDSADPSALDLEQLVQYYRQTKANIYQEFGVLPQRHNKSLRFQRLLEELCKIKNLDYSEAVLEQTMMHYWETFEKEAKVFKDTYETLKHLQKDFLLIILTNNCFDEALRKLQVFGLEQETHYDILVTAECLGYCKDAEGCFEYVQEYLENNYDITLIPDRVIVVGDEFSDVVFANKAGLASVRIKQDLFIEKTPNNSLEEPNYTINTLSELITIMRTHFSSQ